MTTRPAFWPSAPQDQATPRASVLNEQNPFDGPAHQQPQSHHPAFPSSAAATRGSIPVASTASGLHPPPTTTSSHQFQAHAPPRLSSGLLAPGALQTAMPTTHVSTVPPDFDLHLPPRTNKIDGPIHSPTSAAPPSLPPAHATGPSQPPAAGSDASVPSPSPAPPPASTTSSTVTPTPTPATADVVPPVGVGVGPPAKGKTRSTSATKGQLTVSIFGARNLRGVTAHSRPYAVVSFDKNEWVGREPINAPTLHGGVDAMQLDPGTGTGTGTGGGGTRYDPIWEDEVTFDVTYEGPKLFISVYDRHADDEGFIGMRDITPVLKEHRTSEHWHSLIGREYSSASGTIGNALVPVDAGETERGQIKVKLRYERRAQRKLTPRDFEYMKLIGRGTFGRVFQVRKKDTRRIYAMKVLSKREIALKKEVVHTMGERKILEKSLDCPFLVGLKFSFQSETELFFVTDYKSGGELFWHLQREGRFTEERAKFYIAELVLALEHLHKYNIVYRDLKPENILLDAMGHVALCDFGLSKPDLGNGQLTSTFCGTTEYLAPEVLLDESGYSKLVDFWSLGVLLFEMCCGWSPFYAEDTQQMYRNICFGKIKFPRGAIGDNGKQFVKGLLNRNPRHRLGALNDAQDLKQHAFFAQVDWDLLANKKIPPPFKPLVASETDTSNFDPEFTGTDLRSVVRGEENGVGLADDAQVGSEPEGDILSSSVQHQFSGFSYSGRDDPYASSIGGRSRRGSSGFCLASSLASARGGTGLSMSRMNMDEA